MRHRVGMFVCWLCSVCLLAACTTAAVATPQPVTIHMAGATAATLAMHDLSTAYSQRHPHIVFDIRGGGSTLAEEWTAGGEYDLGISILVENARQDAPIDSPAIAGADAAATPTVRRTPSANLVRTPIALDGLAIIVHASNDISSLSLLQLRDLFSGQILNWQEVGGSDESVQLVSREDESGARLIFEERVMGDEAVSLTSIVMPTHADVFDYVATNPQAIGYTSRGYVADLLANEAAVDEQDADNVNANGDVRVVAIEDVYPTVSHLREQTYPLVYPIYLISRGAPRGPILQFIDFVLSPAGQEIIARYHAPLR